MASESRRRFGRNILFVLLLIVGTIVLVNNLPGSWFGRDDTPGLPEEEFVNPDYSDHEASEDDVDPSNHAREEITLLEMSFQDFAEEYSQLQDDFRLRDSLVAAVDGRHVRWEGHVRNVSRYTSAMIVSVWSQEQYSGPSASISFDHSMEDELYELNRGEYVRFEGEITRAMGSVGIDGTAIEVVTLASE